ncbi:uncharacterized protein LOC108696993 isoform X3 [Xenopus laevis]|uniref:Uncharacterized protein LOC108696993 isoform X3 n=1 Tax=Xenopus laevis TaxID=8355 RepID=A0A8J1L6B3_XENLA|nr:uncharacterized protein LOC108696993 isoform X3 [Xenopus laevis]XP_041425093.1 uncharacterized protein LOC108696993 isoform X3 [Xenopus laevis]
MFITVLYGGDVELADQSGQVKNLLENPQRYASELLNERETCVLLSVTKLPGSTEATFTPLLNDDEIVNAKFLAKLGNWGESRVSSRRSKSKKGNKKNVVLISTPIEVKQNTSPRKRSTKS